MTTRGSLRQYSSLQEFGWEVNYHPSYSLDLAPSDFHLFLHLKKFLSGHRRCFQNEREEKMSVTAIPIPGGRLVRHRIQKLAPRYDKCINSRCENVENSSKLAVFVSINLSIKLGFVSVTGTRKSYLWMRSVL